MESPHLPFSHILSYDELNKLVTLRLADQSTLKISEPEFSTINRAWILQ